MIIFRSDEVRVLLENARQHDSRSVSRDTMADAHTLELLVREIENLRTQVAALQMSQGQGGLEPPAGSAQGSGPSGGGGIGTHQPGHGGIGTHQLVDTRVWKPTVFTSKDNEWADWSFTYKAYISSLNEPAGTILERLEEPDREAVDYRVLDAEKQAWARQVYFSLTILPCLRREVRRRLSARCATRMALKLSAFSVVDTIRTVRAETWRA